MDGTFDPGPARRQTQAEARAAAPQPSNGWEAERARLTDYFDRTAAKTWERLTSDAPVSRIRATVRAGRDEMRQTMLAWMAKDLTGARVLDAGCGTGAMAVELARRGADVVAVDVAENLVRVAAARAPRDLPGRIDWRVGDMTDVRLGYFDHTVAMDSLIHYPEGEITRALSLLMARTRWSAVVTHAPRTPLLSLMHGAGRLFPRGDRAPLIRPVGSDRLRRGLNDKGLATLRTRRVARGFYISQALEVVHP